MRVDGNYGNNYPTKQTQSAKSTKAKSDAAELEKKSGAAESEKADKKAPAKRTDSFTRSDNTSVQTDYKSKTALGMKNEAMKDIVAQMLGKQASGASGKKGFEMGIEKLLKSYGLTPIQSDGSDDFWGAEKTANRILDMAKSLVGDDKEAFGKIKAAFEKGFGECEKIWGGKLPSDCYDTLDRVRSGFDAWEKEKFGSTDKAE